MLAYPGAKYAFATAYLMLFACFNYNCCVPHASCVLHVAVVYFSQLALLFSVYILLCILFCALLRAILICIFIPWPAERAAQHIFRLYAYYNARDRRTEGDGKGDRERGRQTTGGSGVWGKREGMNSLKRAEPALTISWSLFPTKYSYTSIGYISFGQRLTKWRRVYFILDSIKYTTCCTRAWTGVSNKHCSYVLCSLLEYLKR